MNARPGRRQADFSLSNNPADPRLLLQFSGDGTILLDRCRHLRRHRCMIIQARPGHATALTGPASVGRNTCQKGRRQMTEGTAQDFPDVFAKTKYDGYQSYSYLEAGADYDEFKLAQAIRSRSPVRPGARPVADRPHHQADRREHHHQPARPSADLPGRHRPGPRLHPHRSRAHGIRGPRPLGHDRRLRQPDGWHRLRHQQVRLEVGRHHLRPRHAAVRHRPPGLRSDRATPSNDIVRAHRQRSDRPGPLARGRNADRERGRPTGHPLWLGRAPDGHRLLRGQRPRLGAEGGRRRRADRVRPARRRADEQARHRHRRLALGRPDLHGHLSSSRASRCSSPTPERAASGDTPR